MIRAMSKTDTPYPDHNLLTGAKYSPQWHGLAIPQGMTHNIDFEHEGEIYDEALVGSESAFDCLFQQVRCSDNECGCPWHPGKIEIELLKESPAKK